MARGYRRKRSYATRNRILVHLSQPGFPPPLANLHAFTQEGIGEATFSARTTVTKWLGRLERQGFVAGERRHVPGHRVRKIVYHLGEAGWPEARRIRRRLETDVVEVRPPGTAPVPMRVAHVPRFFPNLVDLTAAVSLVREGRLDLTGRSVTQVGSSSLLWGDALRTVDRLFGRAEELRTLDAWAGSPVPALAVVGPGGIGKSALVASWVMRRRPRAHAYWIDLDEGITPGFLLADIAAFLERVGRRSLSMHLAEQGAADVRFAARILSVELRGLSALFVFDNFQKAPSGTRRLLAGPFLEKAQGSPTKVVFVDRSLPEVVRWGRGRVPGMHVLRVGGLDLEASMALLRAKGLAADDETTAHIAESTRGHPLSLALAAQGGTAVRGEVQRYLDREVWRTLSEGERAALQAASVFRSSAPVAALRTFPGVTESALAGLHRKDLLQPTITECVVLHDLFRESVLGKLTENDRRRTHAHAARYFLRRLEAYERLEGLHHLIRAGQFSEAAEILESEASELLDSLCADGLAAVLSEFDPLNAEPTAASVLMEVHGDSLRIAGQLGSAEDRYRRATEFAERLGRLDRIPRLLRKIATMARTRNDSDRALGFLREARQRLESHPDDAELAEVLKETALLEEARGRFDEALALLNRAVDLATHVADPAPLARSLLVLGSIETGRGMPELGLQHKLEALRIAERAGNITEAARACISIGTSMWSMDRLEEALAYHERGLQLATLVGNLRLVAYAHLNRAAALIDLGRPDEVGDSLSEGRRIFELLEERDALAMLEISEGQLASLQGRWDDATRIWAGALETLRRVGSPGDLSNVLREIGRYYAAHGSTRQAHTLLREALEIARGLGNESLAREIEALLGAVRSDPHERGP